jgi:hypothetical protein
MNYPLKNVKFINEGVTFANELIFKKIIEVLKQEVKDVSDFLNKVATELNNKEVWDEQRTILANVIQKRYNIDMSGVIGMPDEGEYNPEYGNERLKLGSVMEEEDDEIKKAQKLLNDLEEQYKKFKTESETEGKRIKLIQTELNNLDTSDFKKLLDKFIRNKTAEKTVKGNLKNLIDELRESDRKDKNLLLDILKNKIGGSLENLELQYQDDEEGEEEDGDSISPAIAFKILKDNFVFNAIYTLMKKKAMGIDAGIEIAEKRIGTVHAKLNPMGENAEQMILAKKLVLAYLVIVSSFMMANYVTEEDKTETIEEGLNKDIENILNKYYYSEINVSALVTAPIKLFTVPARFAFKIGNRAAIKALTITSAKELTESPKSFITNARRYFLMLGGNSNQMEKVLNQYGIDFDVLSKIKDYGVNKQNVMKSSNKLVNMFNRMAISKTAYKLFQEYGIKQTFGAKLGEMAGKKVDSLKDNWGKEGARKEEMPDDKDNVFARNDSIDKSKVEETTI